MVILRPDADEHTRALVLDRIGEIVTSSGGGMGKVDEWGKRRFAYEIDHMTEGYYYVVYFNAEVPTLDEVTRVLKITDAVVRHMPVRLEEPVAEVPLTSRAAAVAPAPAVPDEAPAAEAEALEEAPAPEEAPIIEEEPDELGVAANTAAVEEE